MSFSRRLVLIPALLAVCAAALYLPRLAQAPAYLSNDEVCIALNARSIAATGHDLDGRFMPPLFYSPAYLAPNRVRLWFLPGLVYVVALVLKILPFSEVAIRLPLALAGVADVVLIYFVGLTLFKRPAIAALAAVFLMLTPTHFAHARLALPAQISGPFVLGWLLCLLLYLERPRLWLLFASGVLLGIAAIGYIGPLVALYGLLTCVALYQTRDRWQHYGVFILGGMVPCVYFVWLFLSPAALSDILGHYQQTDAAGASLATRALSIASLYWNFWSPQFLFVQGAVRFARAAGVIGVFLLPMAGLLVVGVLGLMRRLSVQTTLLLGGILAAPIPASFVGEDHAIWRALEIAPFGVLVAAYGLDQFLAEKTSRMRWTIFIAVFAVPIAIAMIDRDALNHAQPMIRMLLVPLAIAGVAVIIRRLPAKRFGTASSVLVPLAALVLVQTVAVTRFADVATVTVAAFVILSLTSGVMTATTLTLLAGQFLFLHVDYPTIHRVGVIPASAVLLALRLGATAIALPLTIAALRLRRATSAPSSSTQIVAASAAIVVLQLAYFHVDFATAPAARFLLVLAVLVAATALAAGISTLITDHMALARVGVVALCAAAFIQFGYFYADYLTDFPQRNASTAAGNVKMAWDDVLDRAGRQQVPSVFIGPMSVYGDAELYWRFYLIRHQREDLLERTIRDQPFDRNRIRQLAPGSLIVATPSADVDKLIDEMTGAGELRNGDAKQLLRADGLPLYWVVERASG